MRVNIAIDGPSAAGKSSIAEILAQKLGFVHLDTGAMYRCAAYKALTTGMDPEDETALVRMLKETKIELTPSGNVFLDDQDVTRAIRTAEVSMAASRISAHARIRSELVRRQQEMARTMDCVMDGRDIGTVVLPHAQVKIFLTASVHARALRRLAQIAKDGGQDDLASIEKAIIARDDADMHRAVSPLVQAPDAILIDNSSMTKEETVAAIMRYIEPVLQR